MNKSYFLKHSEVLRGNSADTPGKQHKQLCQIKAADDEHVFFTDTFLSDFSIYLYTNDHISCF